MGRTASLMKVALGSMCLVIVAACSAGGARATEDAGAEHDVGSRKLTHDATSKDALPEAVREAAPGDAGGLDDAPGRAVDATRDAPDALAPLAACEPAAEDPALGCPAALGVDFMCGVNDAVVLTSLGCTWQDVVGSAELLACCPPCPGTDGGACYR